MYDRPVETPEDGPPPDPEHDPAVALDAHGIDPEVFRRRWWTLSVLCLSLLIIMIGNTSLNVALPSLSDQLGATTSQLQWMVDAYSLVFAGLLFAMGNFGDRYGRKGILQIGLVVFGLSTGYAALMAETSGQLIAARVVMGVGAAMVMPATLSIITNIFPTEERAKAVGAWAGISGAGAAIGPLLSGFVLEHGDWNDVFAVNLPFVLAALLLGAFLVPRSRGEHDTPLDLVGAGLSAVGLTTVVYAIIEGPVHGWLSPVTIGVGTLGLVVLIGFVLWELRVEHPMLDVRLFRIGAFGTSSLILTMVFFALMGTFFSMSQLLQLVWGYSPLEAAIRMSPISVAIMIAAPRSARLAARYGKRRVVAIGMWMVAAGVLVMATTVGVEPVYPVLLVGLFVMALGMGTAMSPTTDLLMSSVPRAQAGMGSAMNDTTRELGGSLGVAIFGSLLASRYAQGLTGQLGAVGDDAQAQVSGSLAGALRVSAADERAASLALVAKEAWVDGFRFSSLVAAIVVALAGALAWRYLPDQAADVHPADRAAVDA